MSKKILGSMIALSAVSVSFAQNSSLSSISSVSSISSETTSVSSVSSLDNTASFAEPGPDYVRVAGTDRTSNVGSSLGLGLMIAYFALLLFTLILWIRMLVDAIKHDSKDRTMWILIMLLAGILGSIAYYFVVYKPRKTAEKNGSLTTSSTTTTTTVSTPTTPSV